eukprot:gene15398-biopygen9679
MLSLAPAALAVELAAKMALAAKFGRQRWRWRQSWRQQWRWRQRWRWRHRSGAKPGGMAAKLAASMALAAYQSVVAREFGQGYQSSQCQRYQSVSGSKAGGKAGGNNGAGGKNGAGGTDLSEKWRQRQRAPAAPMALAARLAASMALAAWRQ